MDFTLTNEHRKYMGLQPIRSNYELKKISKNDYHTYYVYFVGEKIVKIIECENTSFSLYYHEKDVNYDTKDRIMVLPKTNRGKARKLTPGVIDTLEGIGNYFFFFYQNDSDYSEATIGNYTTQRTYYENRYIENCKNLDELREWCDTFVQESTDHDLQEVRTFAIAKRQHINFQKGDYFRVKLGRHQYTYGRVLLDIYKERKKGNIEYWDILMGRPVIIEIFHILTERKNVTIEELKQLKTFPSQHILDNKLYYGDFEIIGNDPIPEKVCYPIMYGRGLSKDKENVVYFQCGNIHRELPIHSVSVRRDYRNHAIGFNLDVDEKIIETCVKANSNDPYWQKYIWRSQEDLRSPMNKEKLKRLLKELNLEELIDLYCS